MSFSRYLFSFNLAGYMYGWLLLPLLLSGCQTTKPDEREPQLNAESQYNLANMDADKRREMLHIGLSEEEVIKLWGEPAMREPSPEDKEKTTWLYTRVIPVTRYILKEKQDEKTGETIYVEEPVESLLEHVSRKVIFVKGKLDSWFIYPAGLTPDMSRAVPYTVEEDAP
jgi:hypothetical protein